VNLSGVSFPGSVIGAGVRRTEEESDANEKQNL
jgi:hypothetical protein